MHPQTLSIKNFNYDLPSDRIAFHPLAQRDDSKLLIYKQGAITTDVFKNTATHIPHNTFMIFNNTKVVEARLLFQKNTGGIIEIFCLEPGEDYPDVATAMSQTESVKWICLLGKAAKWKKELPLHLTFEVDGKNFTLEAQYIKQVSDNFLIDLKWNVDLSFAEVLQYAGHMPLPPYIKRPDEILDRSRYQTVYAENNGSVAAPTAGLHFTNNVLDALFKKKIQSNFVTLHVGAGTFKPVKAETMMEHEMHSEFIEVEQILIQQLIEHQKMPIVAVGTTSLRTLESLYWLGTKLIIQPNVFNHCLPNLTQWEVYDIEARPDMTDALQAILNYLQKQQLGRLVAKTQIIIAPGYSFKVVNGLITNFHQPASTLLLLVAAFIGSDWKKVYQYALNNEFRFLSYGDGSLLWR